MADSNPSSALSWHLLEFYRDKDNSCALTVYVDNVRAHVIADSSNFQNDDKVSREYRSLINKLSKATTTANVESNQSNDSRADSGESLCDIDAAEQEKENIEASIQDWMITPVLNDSNTQLKNQTKPGDITIQSWYHCPSHFFELEPTSDGEKLRAKLLENTDELESRMHDLIPSMALPKYISEQIHKPLYNAKDLLVVASSDQPPGTPYHPCRVRFHDTTAKEKHNQETLFIKIVDKAQLAPAKRELDVLDRIASRGLHKKMRVPVVQGLVYFDGEEKTEAGKLRMMGFLQTDIPSATPLTESLDPSVPQAKREQWAREADRMKTLLHDNDIVWGDAKADNFMVDADDNLWIIDFGGSYTEGWIDPTNAETIEGDDEGVARVIDALIDPVNNMEPEEGSENERGAPWKRKRGSTEHDDEDDDRVAAKKRSKMGEDANEEETAIIVTEKCSAASPASKEYCICDGKGAGDMVACDGEDCAKEWFHFPCVGLETAPPSEQEWYCEDCNDT